MHGLTLKLNKSGIAKSKKDVALRYFRLGCSQSSNQPNARTNHFLARSGMDLAQSILARMKKRSKGKSNNDHVLSDYPYRLTKLQ